MTIDGVEYSDQVMHEWQNRLTDQVKSLCDASDRNGWSNISQGIYTAVLTIADKEYSYVKTSDGQVVLATR